jgi:hypothetical protein
MLAQLIISMSFSTALADENGKKPSLPLIMDRNIACQKVFEGAQALGRGKVIENFDTSTRTVFPKDDAALAVYSNLLIAKGERVALVRDDSIRRVQFFDGIILNSSSHPIANLKILRKVRLLNLASTIQFEIENIHRLLNPDTWLNVDSFFRYNGHPVGIDARQSERFAALFSWISGTMSFYGLWDERPTRLLLDVQGKDIEKYLNDRRLSSFRFAIDRLHYENGYGVRGKPAVESATLLLNGNQVIEINKDSYANVPLPELN